MLRYSGREAEEWIMAEDDGVVARDVVDDGVMAGDVVDDGVVARMWWI